MAEGVGTNGRPLIRSELGRGQSMGWAKYHEDNVSRFWRDANTQVRVVHGTQDRPASKAGAGDDLGELKLLRRRLAENPCDRSAQLTFHAEKSRLEKLGISTGEILGVIHPSSTKIPLSDCLCAIHRFGIGTTDV